MIRIWNGTMIHIEEEEYDREKVLDHYRAYKDHKDVKFVVTNNEKIISVLDYKEILLKRRIENNLIMLQKNVFEQATQYFLKIKNLYSGCAIGVINNTGKLEFILEYYDNSNFTDKERFRHCYKWFYTQENKLDYKKESFNDIFSNTRFIIFEKLEEYTLHLAKLLLSEQQSSAKRKICFLDRNALYFFSPEIVSIFSSYSEITDNLEESIVITEHAEEIGSIAIDKRNVFKSAEVMMLLYEEEISKQLKPQVDKKFIIYSDEYIINGIVDLLKYSMDNANIARCIGCIPVIEVTDNLVYGNGRRENVWDYYFNYIDGYSVDQAYASGNYEVVTRNYTERIAQQNHQRYINHLHYSIIEELKKISWAPEIVEYCESEIPKEFKENKRILGVISRGTDYKKPAVIARRGKDDVENAGVEQLIRETKMRMEHYDYIYIATEDYNNYYMYLKAFGDKLITTKQERINLLKNKEYEKLPIAKIPREKQPFEYGLDYLVVLTCLGKCDSLLSSMNCGAYIMSIALNNNKYEEITIVKPE